MVVPGHHGCHHGLGTLGQHAADGSINPGDMTSFNHYAFGAVADFLHRQVAGLAPAAPGYRELLVAPRPGGGLTEVEATHLTPYGPARVHWRRDGEQLIVDLTVPPSTTARVMLPATETVEVASVNIGSSAPAEPRPTTRSHHPVATCSVNLNRRRPRQPRLFERAHCRWPPVFGSAARGRGIGGSMSKVASIWWAVSLRQST